MGFADNQYEAEWQHHDAQQKWIGDRAREIERCLLGVDRYGRESADKVMLVKPAFADGNGAVCIWDEFGAWADYHLTGGSWLRDLARGRAHKVIEQFALAHASFEAESLGHDYFFEMEVFS